MTDRTAQQTPAPLIVEPATPVEKLDLSGWETPATVVEASTPRGLAAESGPAFVWTNDFDESPEDFIDSARPATAPTAPVALNDQFDMILAPKVPDPAKLDPLLSVSSASPPKMFTLVDPNRRWVMWVAMASLGGILAASLVSSFTSVYASAAWIGLPPAVQWLPVIILDVAIVGYSWALMVRSSRLAQPRTAKDETELKPESLARTRSVLIMVTVYSIAANFLHTLNFWDSAVGSPEAIFGIIFSASIPLLALFAIEELITLVFIRRRRVHGSVIR